MDKPLAQEIESVALEDSAELDLQEQRAQSASE
jgi:hypothetical protein